MDGEDFEMTGNQGENDEIGEGEGTGGVNDDTNHCGHDDIVEDSSRMFEKQYQEEQFYLRNILPEEMWLKILNMVAETDDLINCVNASPYFWELKRRERAVFLFPKVMELLVLENYQRDFICLGCAKEGVKEAEDNKQEENQVVAEEQPVLAEEGMEEDDENIVEVAVEDNEAEVPDESAEWRQMVLNCRRVCSNWNEAIEKIYEGPLINGIQEIGGNNLDPTSLENTRSTERSKWKLRNRSLEDVQQALQHFEESHASGIHAPPKNPGLTRYLLLLFDEVDGQEEEEEELKEYLKAATKFLTLFGQHVWYIHIEMYIRNDNFPVEQLYMKIREWLSLMPNLKFLRMIGPRQVEEDGDILPVDLFRRNPLPKLVKLEVVVLRFTAGPIVTELLRSNGGQLRHLTVRDVDDVDPDIVGDSLVNLESFAVKLPTLSDGAYVMTQVLSGWNNLTKLKLCTEGERFEATFKLLENHLGDTLIDLWLHYSHTTLFEESKTLRLKLPKLRRLKLNFKRKCCLLDFTLALADNLERLEVIWNDAAETIFGYELPGIREERETAMKEQIIQFVGFEKKMEESNIWNFFRKLKTIKIGDSSEDCRKDAKFMVCERGGKKLVFQCQHSRYDEEDYFTLISGL